MCVLLLERGGGGMDGGAWTGGMERCSRWHCSGPAIEPSIDIIVKPSPSTTYRNTTSMHQCHLPKLRVHALKCIEFLLLDHPGAGARADFSLCSSHSRVGIPGLVLNATW